MLSVGSAGRAPALVLRFVDDFGFVGNFGLVDRAV